jgi:hypothetical protein
MGKFGSVGSCKQVDETAYYRLTEDRYGYTNGAVVAARVDHRDRLGAHVHLLSKDFGVMIPLWTDIASLQELTAMEVMALAAAGRLPEV